MPLVVLIGPPGSGKSSVGKALAKYLGAPFIDTDSLVERSTGRKIAEIFVDEGEEFFRDLEYTALTKALEDEKAVVSLGGGAPISERAQSLFQEVDYPIVFLDISLAAAAPRVGFNRDRPLLLGNPRAQWQSLYEIRKPIYTRLATTVVKVDSLTTDQAVQEIMRGTGIEKH
jgi:shikimate kinase